MKKNGCGESVDKDLQAEKAAQKWRHFRFEIYMVLLKVLRRVYSGVFIFTATR